MIKEDYVSFETAKLLKEKGFDETCRAFWKVWDNYTAICDCSSSKRFEYCSNSVLEQYNDDEELNISAPTLQMAMKWLREVHNIAINIGWGKVFEKDYRWWCIIISQKNDEILRDSEYHKTYEQACEAAIKYCLENLI